MPTHSEFDARDNLVADDPEDGSSHPDADVGRPAMDGQLVDADDGGKRRAGPDDEGDAEAGQVLRTLVAVGVGRCRRPP